MKQMWNITQDFTVAIKVKSNIKPKMAYSQRTWSPFHPWLCKSGHTSQQPASSLSRCRKDCLGEWQSASSSLSVFYFPAWEPRLFSGADQTQRCPGFLAAGTSFVEDDLSMHWGWGAVSGWFKCTAFTMCFISIIMTPPPPQIIRQ